MINQNKKALSEKASTVIKEVLEERIPFSTVIPADESNEFVLQSDIFGYIDSIVRLPSTRLYCNQSKSRNDNRSDLCFEFRSFRGRPQSLATGESAPIAGAHWVSSWNRWLAPRFSQADVLTYYLPMFKSVYHYSRYYLEIMFSKESTWQHVKALCNRQDDVETYIGFWDYNVFNQLYLETVRDVTCGSPVTIDPEEIERAKADFALDA